MLHMVAEMLHLLDKQNSSRKVLSLQQICNTKVRIIMKFEEKLIKLRKSNGMSQEQLAEKLGVSRQAISRWESGDSTPDMINLLGLCECFKVSSDYLIHDDYESDEDMPIVQEKNEEITNIRAKRKEYHLVSAICFLLAVCCSIFGIFSSVNDVQFVLSVFTCTVLSGLTVVQFVLYLKKE